MTDIELLNMETEHLNKSVDKLIAENRALKTVLNNKASEEGTMLANFTKQILLESVKQNENVGLYGKNSFEATYHRGLCNTWCDVLRAFSWDVSFSYKGDYISDIRLYNDKSEEVAHHILAVDKDDIFDWRIPE